MHIVMSKVQAGVEEEEVAEEEGELVLSAEDTQMVTGFIITTPHFCHEPTSEARVNFFWPVQIFTDLTRKIGNLLCILP